MPNFSHLIQHLHNVHSLPAALLIFAGMALESTAVPLPSEVVLPVAGIWALEGKFGPGPWGIIAAILICCFGSLVGSGVAYAIGNYGGWPLLERYGSYILIPPHHLKTAQSWLQKHGTKAVFGSRFVFGIRHVSSVGAGSLRLQFWHFLLGTLAGVLVWNTAGILLGYFLGEKVAPVLRWISLGLLAAVVIGIFMMVIRARRAGAGHSSQ